MAKTLKGLGFQVISATNQDRRGMSNSLSAFERALGQGDTAFFFFAGHGFQIKGENYLLPTDVPLALAGEEEKVHENCVPGAPHHGAYPGQGRAHHGGGARCLPQQSVRAGRDPQRAAAPAGLPR